MVNDAQFDSLNETKSTMHHIHKKIETYAVLVKLEQNINIIEIQLAISACRWNIHDRLECANTNINARLIAAQKAT